MKKGKNFVVKNPHSMRKSIIIGLILIFFGTLLSCFAANSREDLNSWVGKYPIEKSKNLLKDKELSTNLKLLIGEDLYNKLINLENEAYYLISPIEKKYNYYILHYPANLHINREADMIFLFINEETYKFHFAQIIDGKITWKHGEQGKFPKELKDIPSKWTY